MNDNEKRCRTCRFCEQKVVHGEPCEWGICRRHAPRPAVDWDWPAVGLDDDWCGEHSPCGPTGADLANGWLNSENAPSANALGVLKRIEAFYITVKRRNKNE